MTGGKTEELREEKELEPYINKPEYTETIKIFYEYLYSLSPDTSITKMQLLAETGATDSDMVNLILKYIFKDQSSISKTDKLTYLRKKMENGQCLYFYSDVNDSSERKQERKQKIKKGEQGVRDSLKSNACLILKKNPLIYYSREDLISSIRITDTSQHHILEDALEELVAEEGEAGFEKVNKNGTDWYYYNDLPIIVITFLTNHINTAYTVDELLANVPASNADKVLLEEALQEILKKHGKEGFLKTDDERYLRTDFADRLYETMKNSPGKFFIETQLQKLAETQAEEKYLKTALIYLIKHKGISKIIENKQTKYRYLPP